MEDPIIDEIGDGAETLTPARAVALLNAAAALDAKIAASSLADPKIPPFKGD